jgi:hypothetical protein
LQRSYGNQALILQAWGRLEEAMALLKKAETLCLDQGSRFAGSARRLFLSKCRIPSQFLN